MPAVDPASYLGLVHYLARRMHRRLPASRRDVARDDLLQAGFLGLLEAGRAWDPSRGVPFVAFARPRIVGAMLDLLGGLDASTKRERRSRRERDATEVELAGRLGRTPTADEVAAALGISLTELDALATREAGTVSLDDETAHGHEPATDELAPEEAAARQELVRAVGDCLEALRAEMRVVVLGRLLDGLTLEALGRLLRGSKDRIWRLERAARRSLRSCLEQKGWEAEDTLAVIEGGAR